ncbi:Uncharacterised protein [Mycobacteroides abscessus subsp. abscessus]|nr:Uncharacterised protein [Mycobacteroides abscessus subsp. abscessus]
MSATMRPTTTTQPSVNTPAAATLMPVAPISPSWPPAGQASSTMIEAATAPATPTARTCAIGSSDRHRQPT